MADENHCASNTSGSVWKYIPLDDHAALRGLASDAVKNNMFRLSDAVKKIRDWIRQSIRRVGLIWRDLPGTSPSDERIAIPQDLEALPHRMLARIAPEPGWEEAASALEAALEDWLDAERPSPTLRIVVGAPYSGTQNAVSKLAAEKNWRLIDPPTSEEILGGGEDWLRQVMDDGDSPIVISHLERCYLRHYNGLSLIRKLLDVMLSANRRFLLGCNSWAWAYLNKALDFGALLPTPLTLQALDREHLQCWFKAHATSSGDSRFVFRQTDNAALVLPDKAEARVNAAMPTARDASPHSDEESKVDTDFLDHLAAYSRGIPGVAWAVWRHSLVIAHNESAKGQVEAAPATGSVQTIWVKPWTQLCLPSIPDEVDRSQLFVLQTILLHDSLPPRLLRQLLSLSSTDVLETLHRLRNAGLLDADRLKATWRVTPEGYPVVRQLLEREGYLVGAF